MKKLAMAVGLAALFGANVAQATTYNITTTWLEPQTQPRNSIFTGSFDYDLATHTVTNLHGMLSESMTDTDGMPIDAGHMVWLDLNNQLVSWYDAGLHGTFAAAFKNTDTSTFVKSYTLDDGTVVTGDGWSPQWGVEVGGIYAGFPSNKKNPGNAYALIFVPDDPLAALSQSQIDKLAYADCVPTAAGGMMMGGGMMGAVCMTGTSVAGYGMAGTMDGYPVSQTITAAVPEPETYAMMMAGLALVGFMSRRRKAKAAAV